MAILSGIINCSQGLTVQRVNLAHCNGMVRLRHSLRVMDPKSQVTIDNVDIM